MAYLAVAEVAGMALSLFAEWLGPKIPRAVKACDVAGFQQIGMVENGVPQWCDGQIKILKNCLETVKDLIKKKEEEKKFKALISSPFVWILILLAVFLCFGSSSAALLFI